MTFFLLEHQKEDSSFEEIGIVVITDKGVYESEIEAAASKIGMKIVDTIQSSDPAVGFVGVRLSDDYYLSEMPEICSLEDVLTLR